VLAALDRWLRPLSGLKAEVLAWAGVAAVRVAILSCLSWDLADAQAGQVYSHPSIPYWNALVRLGFFLVTGLLIAALRWRPWRRAWAAASA